MFGAHCGPPLRHSFCDIFFSLSLSRSLSSGNRRALIEIRCRCAAGRSDDVMVTIGSELFPTPKVPIVRVCVCLCFPFCLIYTQWTHACMHPATFLHIFLRLSDNAHGMSAGDRGRAKHSDREKWPFHRRGCRYEFIKLNRRRRDFIAHKCLLFAGEMGFCKGAAWSKALP